MQGGGRDQEHRVQPGIREQLAIVAIQACDTEILLRPGELILDRAAGGDQLCARDAPREIFRMPAPQTAKAGDTDAQAGRGGHLFLWRSEFIPVSRPLQSLFQYVNYV